MLFLGNSLRSENGDERQVLLDAEKRMLQGGANEQDVARPDVPFFARNAGAER